MDKRYTVTVPGCTQTPKQGAHKHRTRVYTDTVPECTQTPYYGVHRHRTEPRQGQLATSTVSSPHTIRETVYSGRRTVPKTPRDTALNRNSTKTVTSTATIQ